MKFIVKYLELYLILNQLLSNFPLKASYTSQDIWNGFED